MMATALALTLLPGRPLCDGRQLLGAASTISAGLASTWIDTFNRLEPQSRATLIQPAGPPIGRENAGLTAFLTGRADFAFITREIAESDRATFRDNHAGREPLIIPVAGGAWDRFGYVDAVTVIVNATNPLRRLSFRQLDGIFSASRLRGSRPIRTWEQAGAPQWRGRDIHIVGADAWDSEESARALTMRRRVLSVDGRRGVWRPALSSGAEADVVTRVAADPLAIGFTGMGHLNADVRSVAIAISDHGRAYRPTAWSVAHDRYPLARTVDLLVARGGACSAELRSFSQLITSERGQQLVATSPFMRLPQRLRMKAWRQENLIDRRGKK